MAYEEINVGAAPNDHTGDPLRDAMQTVNANFLAAPLPDLSNVTVEALTAAIVAAGAAGPGVTREPRNVSTSGPVLASDVGGRVRTTGGEDITLALAALPLNGGKVEIEGMGDEPVVFTGLTGGGVSDPLDRNTMPARGYVTVWRETDVAGTGSYIKIIGSLMF